MSILPRYPIYVISKSRAQRGLTARFLIRDGVPFSLIVEPQEADAYAAAFGADRLLILPFSNLGQGSIPARNWVWEHAQAAGHARHWILDDNIKRVCRWVGAKRFTCASGPCFAATEDVIERYENVAVAGLNYQFFARRGDRPPTAPFWLNVHVYSCLLIRNDLPQRWRGRYNEDTDLCLQVLAAGWCTVLLNAFMIDKMQTMTMAGGNSASLYQGDGRLKMARSLERLWPGVVTVDRRWQRPQHVVNWKKFDTPLKLRDGVDLSALLPNEYGMHLEQVAPIKSERLRALYAAEVGKRADA